MTMLTGQSLSLHQGIPVESMREVALLHALAGHPHIVNVLDVEFGEACGLDIVMELCCCNLRDLMADLVLASHRWMGFDSFKTFAHDILSGIAYCHERSIIHCDLKPDNILLDQTRRTAKIADFGMSRMFRREAVKHSGQVVTQWYRCPELIMGATHHTPAIDMWSFGCILVEMISMNPAFAGETEIGTLLSIFRLLGTPSDATYPGITALQHFSTNYPKWPEPSSLFDALRVHRSSPYYSDSTTLDLVGRLLSIDPHKRISAHECMHGHLLFKPVVRPAADPQSKGCASHARKKQRVSRVPT